jgi:uncharacterized membrane protein YgdD (TMEM256/DUF423 family)
MPDLNTPPFAARSSLALIAVGGLLGAAGVAAAAAGAHGDADPRIATASQFLLFHAPALAAIATAAAVFRLGRWALVPGWTLALGALLFSGDLLVRAIHGTSPVPMVAPTGGTLMILGWLALAIGVIAGGRAKTP